LEIYPNIVALVDGLITLTIIWVQPIFVMKPLFFFQQKCITPCNHNDNHNHNHSKDNALKQLSIHHAPSKIEKRKTITFKTLTHFAHTTFMITKQ
jgi:hypothetical protein